MRLFQKLLLPAAIFLLAGCAHKQPFVLSGETALEMQSSIQMLRANMTSDRQEEFDQAIATIDYAARERRLAQNGDRLTLESIRTLRGLSVNQVFETAKLLRTVSAG